jgi:hypothetical protein
MANTNFPLQISKSRSIKGFGENVSQLSLCVFVSHLYVSLLYVVSQKVVSPLKVSHSFVEDWIFCYRDGTGVVAYEGNSLKAHSKSLMVCTIDRIWEQHLAEGTYSASVVDRATEDCFHEDQQIREDPKNGRCRPTTHKISIRKANKIRRRRSRILNRKLECMFEIPEDSLNCHLM